MIFALEASNSSTKATSDQKTRNGLLLKHKLQKRTHLYYLIFLVIPLSTSPCLYFPLKVMSPRSLISLLRYMKLFTSFLLLNTENIQGNMKND